MHKQSIINTARATGGLFPVIAPTPAALGSPVELMGPGGQDRRAGATSLSAALRVTTPLGSLTLCAFHPTPGRNNFSKINNSWPSSLYPLYSLP